MKKWCEKTRQKDREVKEFNIKKKDWPQKWHRYAIG